MVVAPTIYSKRYPDVWTASVRDFQWFNGGGSGKSEILGSQPPSPTFATKQFARNAPNPVARLEQMATNWPAAAPVSQAQGPVMSVIPSNPVTTTKATDEPQPLTYAYAPVIAPSRAPVHYNASAVISVGVLPERRPSKKMPQAGPSLYPTTVQTALNGSSTKRAATAPSVNPSTSTPLQTLPTRASTNPTIRPSEEPLPIRGWPRVNPQEPYHKDRSTPSQPASGRQPAAHPLGQPGPGPSSDVQTPSRRVSRGPRPRPPPLDLSAASPARIR